MKGNDEKKKGTIGLIDCGATGKLCENGEVGSAPHNDE